MRFFFLFFILIFNFFAPIHAQRLFAVRVGTFVNPQRDAFGQLAALGYVHARTQTDGSAVVFAGRFEKSTDAAMVAERIAGMGVQNAAVVAIDLSSGVNAYVVQLQFQRGDRPVDWLRLDRAGALFLEIEGPNIRIVTGIYPDPVSAKTAMERIRSLGFSDAFVKAINTAALHPVGEFERGQEPKTQVKAYDAVVDIPAPAVVNKQPPGISTARRKTVLELQELLQRERFYSGTPDGIYGSGTAQSVENFMQRDAVWQSYLRDARASLAQEGAATSDPVQAAMDAFVSDPNAGDFLQRSGELIAPAYQAYSLWVLSGPGETVDGLMNMAIKAVYRNFPAGMIPPFDFQRQYQYTDINQLVHHLHYLHHAPGQTRKVPCWLFERHPEASMSVYTGLTVISMDVNKVVHCNPVNNWESIRVLLLLADDLSATGEAAGMPQFNALRLAVSPGGLSRAEMDALETWQTAFWRKLTQRAEGTAQLQSLMKTLRFSYRLNLLYLEDHFMNLGFDAGQSRALAIRWLQNALSGKLDA